MICLQDGMAVKTAIIVLTYNNLAYNKGVLRTIEEHTEAGTYELIFVDNASTDGTREWLQGLDGPTVILNDENKGFPGGCNIGIQAAKPGWDILLLNNDVEACHNWLENLKRALYTNPEIGAVQAVNSNHLSDPSVDLYGNDLEAVQAFARENNRSDPARWENMNYLNGFCVLFKRQALDEAGLLDERFNPGNFEDDDISFRLLEKGWRLLRCRDAYVHHFHSKSFKSPERAQRYWNLIETNRQKFYDKWGFDAWDKYLSESQLLRLVDEEPSRELNVLHLGCGLGQTLTELKNKVPKARLFAAGTHPLHLKVLAGICDDTFQTYKGHFTHLGQADSYDYILTGTEFQRSHDPKGLLTHLREYLKPGGYLVINVENPMCFTTLRELLRGSWHYGGTELSASKNRINLTPNDAFKLGMETGYQTSMLYHWYLQTNDDDEAFIEKLCQMTNSRNGPLYRSHLYTVRFQK